ncbi:restriction endonuclease subunit S [Bifidobacterium callitrichos]|uniref:Restriction endonuclease subunit S n=1 Tax=Bifidobacterium callitrichos TaxID=762209 RepID=A0A2T3GC65_9BIFI|nr:restriction endonuclease subunit S [Bifidobacterium callitrichos]PST46991.1 restriction endonuclease subunit S [Bifidobacterium callitrichos]
MIDSMSEPSKTKVNMSRNGDGEKPRMVKLGELLTLDAEPERIDNPADETFVTVRTKCGGAVERVIKDGKIPVAFTGYRIHEGQLIYSRIDARNNAFAIVPSELDGAVVSKDFPVFRVDERKALKSYLMHFFRSGRLQYAIQQYSKGITNRQRIKEEVLLSFSILLPSLEEQRRIVAVLDRADAIRAKRRQILADLDELKQSFFDEMFLSDDFPIVESGDLMPVMRNGLSPSKRGTVIARVLTLSAITQGKFDVSAVKEGTFDTEPPADKRVTGQDFMMCRGNGNKSLVGVGAYSNKDYPDLVFPDTIIAGRVNTDKILLSYLEMVWHSGSVRNQIERSARTTNGTYKVNQQALSRISIPLPPIELQREFARRVEAIAAARAKVERALALDDELFAALQSRAFRGAL